MGPSTCSNGVPTVVLVLLFLSSTVLCDCSTPTLPRSSRLRGSATLKVSYPVGTVLQLVCIEGYELIPGTRPQMTCATDSSWSGSTDICQGKRCPVPNLVDGRIVKSDDLRLGETVTLACDYGFRLIGERILRCILRGGVVRWHRDIPFCEQIPCARPGLISNGRYDPDPSDTYVVGSAVLYRCGADYSLIGNSTITCIVSADGNNGEWNSPPPQCKKVTCARPRIPNGGLATVYKPTYTYGDRVTVKCNPGYTLVGDSWIRCGADNAWKPALPRCDKTVPIPPITPLPPIVPPPPPLIPPTLVVPPEIGETTFIPMFPTPRETIPTVESGSASGSGSGKIVGIVFGIIFGLIVLAALIFAAVRWRNQRKANDPGNSQVASEKGETMDDQRLQEIQSKT